MSKIDTNQWKEFSLKKLGFICHHGQRLNQSNREDGSTPFVTAGFQNNGISQRIGNDCTTYHKAMTIDMFGNCFFQSEDCAGDDNVYFFVNEGISDFCKIFITGCITASISGIYSYTKQFRQQNANELTVNLPTTPSGDPDWAYMDSFMGKILKEEEVAAEQLAALAPESGNEGHFLDVSGWKEFSVKELGFVCHHGQRLNQSERKDGLIPFVTAGFQNHGVTQYISNDRPTYHKAITVDMFGNCFFQADDCAGDDNVYFFVNNKLTDYSKLFVSACIAGVTSKKFSYAKQFRQHDANMLKIFLPTTTLGDPDWEWMEQYMQQQMNKAEGLAEHLVTLE